jgi:hypothetical protein
MIDKGFVDVNVVPSEENIANIITNLLPTDENIADIFTKFYVQESSKNIQMMISNIFPND